jgi:hypothetical protein
MARLHSHQNRTRPSRWCWGVSGCLTALLLAPASSAALIWNDLTTVLRFQPPLEARPKSRLWFGDKARGKVPS